MDVLKAKRINYRVDIENNLDCLYTRISTRTMLRLLLHFKDSSRIKLWTLPPRMSNQDQYYLSETILVQVGYTKGILVQKNLSSQLRSIPNILKLL